MPPLEPGDLAGAVPVKDGVDAPGALDFEGEANVFVFDGAEGIQYQADVTLGTVASGVSTDTDYARAALAITLLPR